MGEGPLVDLFHIAYSACGSHMHKKCGAPQFFSPKLAGSLEKEPLIPADFTGRFTKPKRLMQEDQCVLAQKTPPWMDPSWGYEPPPLLPPSPPLPSLNSITARRLCRD